MTRREPEPATLAEVFAASVRRHGSRPALEVPPGPGRSERIVLRYDELDARAGGIAAAIAAIPLREDEGIVGLLLERAGPDLLAAELACGRLGRPWTALDPALPDARLAEIVADAAIELVIASAATRARASTLGAPRVLVADEVEPAIAATPPVARPDSAAYVIYTSGSTGRPKGVVIEERSLVNLVLSDLETFDLGPGDRVAQGSSAAYDSHLEEVWLALAAGATVLVLDDESLRLGPDLPELLRRERVTVLCPPPTLLRTMGCRDPRRELPDVRLLYVGGEALPPDVAAAWAPGRRLENGYGPTECTVTVMRTTIAPGDPVTIGRPVRGHRALILDEELREVAVGGEGELCIAGIGLARGYLRRPELDAERFPIHPEHGRLYRTGDLVRRDAQGRHHYLGRIDAQVKLRGHRVELGEVEARLAEQPGVREAACGVAGQALVAWLVTAEEVDLDDLRRAMARLLPAALRPSLYRRVPALPRNTAGKIDRRALALIAEPAPVATPDLDPAVALVQEAFRRALERPGPPDPDADFFLELGGHSLAGAVAVSLLRDDPRGRGITVRDLYEHPRARALAAKLAAAAAPETASPSRRHGSGSPLAVTLVQALVIALLVGLGSALAAVLVVWGPPLVLDGEAVAASLLRVVAALAAMALLAGLAAVGGTLVLKRLLVGRYRAGRFPAWSRRHLAHWLVRTAAATIPFGHLRGSGLELAILRLLGARVGRGVAIDRGVDLMRGGWDLLEIGAGAVLGRDAALRTVDLDRGELVLGEVKVGAGAVLESRAALAPGASLGARSRLAALSVLEPGATINPGLRAGGVPAAPLGAAAAAEQPIGPGLPAPLFAVLLLGARALAGLVLALPTLLYVTGLAVELGLDRRGATVARTPGETIVEFAIALPLLVLVDLVLRVLLCRLLGPIRPGRFPARSLAAVRHDLEVGLVEGAGRVLSGTMFWPTWLGLAGMRIGPGCEISSIMEAAPGLVAIGRESFFADGIYLAAPRRGADLVEFAPVTIGAGVFLGNHAVLPGGTTLADGVLLGLATPAPTGDVPPGSSWFGHPAFPLPRRETVVAARELTHEPPLHRRATRLFWELLRFLVPLPPAIVALAAVTALLDGAESRGEFATTLGLAPVLALGAAATMLASVLALKWLLLGRCRAGRHALWSCWCSRWDFLYVVWQAWAVPILRPLEGSLLLAPWLRLMGVRLGRRVLLGEGFAQVVDPDMLRIEDGATVAGLFQAHSFEDRVLKLEPLRIGRGATTGAGSIMLYGAELGEDARLAPHSVAMKRERLPGGVDHVGAPTRERTLPADGS